MRICNKEGCERKHQAKGLCNTHYALQWKKENPINNNAYARKYMAKNSKNPVTIEHVTDSVKERFYAKVDKTEDCWNWTGAKTANRKERSQAPATTGYGYFTINKRPFYTHRLAMLMKQGYLTEGLVVDHLCNNSACVNPDHIQEVSNRQNITRSPRHSMNHGGYFRGKGKKNG